MVYVDRTCSPVIKLRTSADQGQQWPLETEVTLHAGQLKRSFSHPADMQTAWSEMYDYALGLPATAMLPDGDVLVVFYAGKSGDETSIHWARVHP